MTLNAELRSMLASLAPGTELRSGLERILRGRTGALIVLGHDRMIESLCTGGFTLNVPFTATGLRELAKMDGAIILDSAADHIIRAGVQLVPDPSIPTEETGTRHRTADRMAKQTGVPVISVSASMHIIALYFNDVRYVLEEPAAVLGRANQALQTLARYRTRLDEVTDSLSALEIEDLVTVRDIAAVAQRLEMVARIADEIDAYVLELGTDGRLLAMQSEELVGGVLAEREHVIRDYLPAHDEESVRKVLAAVNSLTQEELVDLNLVADALSFDNYGSLDSALTPRGYRILARVPRLPLTVIDRLIEHFGSLQRLLAASLDDLQTVEGVGELRARSVRDSLSRLADSSMMDRYV